MFKSSQAHQVQRLDSLDLVLVMNTDAKLTNCRQAASDIGLSSQELVCSMCSIDIVK